MHLEQQKLKAQRLASDPAKRLLKLIVEKLKHQMALLMKLGARMEVELPLGDSMEEKILALDGDRNWLHQVPSILEPVRNRYESIY